MPKLPSMAVHLGLLGALCASGCGQRPADWGKEQFMPDAAPEAVGAATVQPNPLVKDQAPAGAAPDKASLAAPASAPREVSDQLIVGLKPGTRVTLAAGAAIAPLREFQLDGHYQVVKIPAGMSRDEAIRRLKQHPGVTLVAANRIYAATASASADASLLVKEWNMRITQAPTAWDKHIDASNVTVAVLDTGVDYDHPALKGRVILGPDIPDHTGDPMDTYGHGTHVAGIIGASGLNGQGVAGVARNCKILAIKVLGDNGNGNTDDVVTGIKYAVDHGAKVINLSLGAEDPSVDPVLHMALAYAHAHGTLVVAAAGNTHGQVGSPANDPQAIAVSSTSHLWKFEWLSWFSNRGEKIEVAAPGGGIYSTMPSRGGRLGTLYGTLSGTSMAAPFVAGEAALIMAQHPDWSVDQVRARIDSAVDHKDEPGRNAEYGFGRVNLAKALD